MSGESTLVIIGASGDLANRLLLPALGELLTAQGERRVNLVGAGRTELSDAQWRRRIRSAFATADAADAMSSLASTPYIVADTGTAAGLRTVLKNVPDGRLVLYFAVPPAVAAAACAALAPGELPDDAVLALEKPFGTDEQSAH